MRLLLDTHALLWLLADDARLGDEARDLIIDPANDVFVSAASFWEIVIKLRTGKLEADGDAVFDACRRTGLQVIAVAPEHTLAVLTLPQFEDHRDPFDHLLLAQAKVERLAFVTQDSKAPRYPVEIIRCSGTGEPPKRLA